MWTPPMLVFTGGMLIDRTGPWSSGRSNLGWMTKHLSWILPCPFPLVKELARRRRCMNA